MIDVEDHAAQCRRAREIIIIVIITTITTITIIKLSDGHMTTATA